MLRLVMMKSNIKYPSRDSMTSAMMDFWCYQENFLISYSAAIAHSVPALGQEHSSANRIVTKEFPSDFVEILQLSLFLFNSVFFFLSSSVKKEI